MDHNLEDFEAVDDGVCECWRMKGMGVKSRRVDVLISRKLGMLHYIDWRETMKVVVVWVDLVSGVLYSGFMATTTTVRALVESRTTIYNYPLPTAAAPPSLDPETRTTIRRLTNMQGRAESKAVSLSSSTSRTNASLSFCPEVNKKYKPEAKHPSIIVLYSQGV